MSTNVLPCLAIPKVPSIGYDYHMKLRWDSEVEASHSNAFLLKVYNNSVYKSWTNIVVLKNEKCIKNRCLEWRFNQCSYMACMCMYFPSCFILYHTCMVCINAYEFTLMDDRKNKTSDQTWTNGLMSLTIWKITSRLRGEIPQMWPHIRNNLDVQAGVNALLNH